MSTAQEIIEGGALNINAFSPGQPMASSIAQVCFYSLNDLLSSLSNDQAFVYTQTENIAAWSGGQFKYTVGNPNASSTFAGYCFAGSNVITGVTNAASLNITFGYNGTTSGATTGGTITDLSAALPSGTTIVSVNVAAQTVTVSQNATANTPLDNFTYTVPGNFSFARPLRIRSGYTRVTTGTAAGLDYPFDVQSSLERYNEIGYKGQSGPWPYLVCYQPTEPYGTLWVYPNPSAGNEVHLFTDIILSQFTSLTQQINLPQGYNRALKKLLALEIAPIFGKTPSPQLISQAKEAKDMLKNLNMSPVTTLRYDKDLVYARTQDAGWVVRGGF